MNGITRNVLRCAGGDHAADADLPAGRRGEALATAAWALPAREATAGHSETMTAQR